ncbi:MAG: hypothetical protein EOS03_00550 [Mesorhizobium sp.]|uniref:hypothetical protein n=1 Tax=Mesorhizobium sp. TaxID=1871066 RepID=UPI000FE863F7|nr:hypothetical protein [Mesorhizobium sp.]RWN48984.1 MAG: hypothetical protein EOS03_00550 [Mesorhizobium sp.]TIM96821.1 MAG: hypothetical protein E5Y34_21970 [Mesorhizobium sp.]
MGDELIADLRKRSEVAAVAAQLMRRNPGLDLTPSNEEQLASKEAAVEAERREIARYHERKEEIWAEILPVSNQIMEKLRELPPKYRLWALSQVTGDAVSQMSETKKDAIVRYEYLYDCTCGKIGEVFARREREGAMRE